MYVIIQLEIKKIQSCKVQKNMLLLLKSSINEKEGKNEYFSNN